MDDLMLKNTTEIAVLHERLENVDAKVEKIMTNHLPHIADDLKSVLSNQQYHSKKIIEFDLAKKIIFGAVGLILFSTLTSWVQLVLKSFHS